MKKIFGAALAIASAATPAAAYVLIDETGTTTSLYMPWRGVAGSGRYLFEGTFSIPVSVGFGVMYDWHEFLWAAAPYSLALEDNHADVILDYTGFGASVTWSPVVPGPAPYSYAAGSEWGSLAPAGTILTRSDHVDGVWADVWAEDFTAGREFDFHMRISTVDPIPEPSVWAMLIGGFAGVGAALRRRRAALT